MMLFLMIGLTTHAQDLNRIGKKDMLKLNGGIQVNSIYLNTNNPASKREPFSLFTTGNFNADFLGWSFPFSFSLSKHSQTYTQPFNQIRLNPQYKWIKVFTGWNNFSFSPYTLSGYPVLGGGIELSPRRLLFKAVFGQFKKAVPYDVSTDNADGMSFRRTGFGTQIKWKAQHFQIGLCWFYAKDHPASLSYLPENNRLQPEEGSVYSIDGRIQLNPSLYFEGEYANSLLSRNVLSENNPKSGTFNPNSLFVINRTGTQSFDAYKASAGMQKNLYGLSINYERVQPGYRTLGAFFFNNDLENFTVSPNIKLFKQKMHLNGSIGLQRNNLDKEKLQTTTRHVYSGNINFAPNTHWVLSFSFSNFTSFSRQRPQTNPFYTPGPGDTLQFYQISQNAFAMASYQFKQREIQHRLSGSFNQVNSSVLQQEQTQNTIALNGNFSYALQHLTSKLSLGITANANSIAGPGIETVFFGPGLNISKPILKGQWNLAAGSILNQSYNQNVSTGLVLSHRLSLNYHGKAEKMKFGKPGFSLQAGYVNKPSLVSGGMSLNEITVNASLNYNF